MTGRSSGATARPRRPRVVIIGAGFSGIGMALELTRAGHHDFVILERAAELGGVWRDNTYPGAACDVASPVYSFSYEPNPVWPERYSPQADIHAYLARLVGKYRLGPKIRFGTEVTGARFDESTGRWAVSTATGETVHGDVLVSAVGQLCRPKLPDIPGQDRFAGPSFHSARWRHDVELTGKRVAVIGTGASAIQFVPRIQPKVRELTIFQRSAPYIIPKPNRRYHAAHHWLFSRFPGIQRVERLAFWLFYELSTTAITGGPAWMRLFTKVAGWQLRRQVPDPELRRKLTPDYPMGCKRVLTDDEYYPTLSKPNVRLETARITEITEHGVRTADGTEHAADVIIYGTGFATTDFLAPMDITGLDGRSLHAEWADGARAYLGIAVPNFPNMFVMYGPNTNLGTGSIIFMIEHQARYIRQLVELLGERPNSWLDVRAEVAGRYDAELQARLARSVWANCASWYRRADGRVSANWPGLLTEYHRRTRRARPSDYRLGEVRTPARR